MDELELEQAMTECYQKLLSEQKPLDPEFAKVIYDNLWDLYERD